MQKPTRNKFRSFWYRHFIKENLHEFDGFHADLQNIIYANIVNNHYLDDSLQIAGLLKFYDCGFAEILAAVGISGRSYLLKLSVLDYVIDCFGCMPDSEYFKISENFICDRNPLVRLQAHINLLNQSKRLHLEYLLDANNYENSLFFYRMVNNIVYFERVSEAFSKHKAELIRMIELNKKVNSEQTAELCKMLE